MILSSILNNSAWQLRHSWRLEPTRRELSRVLSELRAQIERDLATDLSSKVYLVCDELLTNSLEHGCFRIGASKKASLLEEGIFEDFLVQSEKEAIINGNCWIELDVEIGVGEVLVKVRDSGTGYEIYRSPNGESLDLARLSQRGLQIVQGLSSNLSIEKNPTQTTASFLLS